MKKRSRIFIRTIALFLLTVFTVEFLSTGLLNDRSNPLNLKAKAAEEAGELNIPCDGPVGGYNPGKNGYFAYVRINYEVPYEDERKDAYLPVLCYNDCIYLRTDLLGSITELSSSVSGSEITITSYDQTRRLYMTVGQTKYLYVEGYTGTQTPPLRKFQITFEVTPVINDGLVYVPLNPVLYLFGLETEISGRRYRITQHREDALDVLMKMYSTAEHENGIAGYSAIPHPKLDNLNVATGASVDYLYGFITADPKAIGMIAPVWGISNLDVRYYKEIVQDLLSIEPDLARKIEEQACETCKQLYTPIDSMVKEHIVSDAVESTGMDLGELRDRLNKLEKLKNIEADYNNAGYEFVPQYNYNLMYKTYSRWERMLNKTEVAGDAVNIGIILFQNALIYANRDTASAAGMKILLQDEGDGKKRNTGSILSEEEYISLIAEFKNFVPDQWVEELSGKEQGNNKKDNNETVRTVIKQSADDVAMSAVQRLIGAVTVGYDLFQFGISSIEFAAKCLNISQVSSANSLVKAYYGQYLLAKIGKKLYSLEKAKLGNNEGSDEDYRDLIALSYLYLRLAKLECDYVINTRHAEENYEKELKNCSEKLCKMIAVLVEACERGEGENEDILISKPQMRIDDAKKSLRNGLPMNAITPLFMKISGTVVEKTEGEPPVPDAECGFSMKNDNSGYFGVNEEGRFSVYLPLQDQEDLLDDLDDLENKEFEFVFSSESVEGSSKAKTAFIPNGHEDLGKIYLSNFSWYKYIRDNIAPEMGWVNLETRTNGLRSNGSYPNGWDYRKGLLSAQITDLDKDGSQDCVLYYFDYDYEVYPGEPGWDDRSTVHVKVLSRDSDGIVRETGARQIVYENGTGFCDAIGGIIEFDGREYVYFECNTNAYFANGYGTLYTFYSYDGTQLRPDFAVGKTRGGSIEFVYAIISYDEDGDLSGLEAVYDGSPWYNWDGTYSMQVLCADHDWLRFHSGESMLMDSFDPPYAMRLGLSMVTGIDPDEVILENADNGYAFGDTYISYRDMDCFTMAFHYNCSGEKVDSSGSRNMTSTVIDNTELLRHVEEAGD